MDFSKKFYYKLRNQYLNKNKNDDLLDNNYTSSDDDDNDEYENNDIDQSNYEIELRYEQLPIEPMEIDQPEEEELNNNFNLENDNSVDFLNLNVEEDDNSNSFKRKLILRCLILLQITSNLANTAVDSILKIINIANENLNIPTSYYRFKKIYNLDIDEYYSFKCCNLNQLKQKDNFECTICKKSISSSKNYLNKDYFFYYDFKKIVSLLLVKYDLKKIQFSNDDTIKSHFDSELFKHFHNIKGDNILSMSIFIDGVRIFKSSKNIKYNAWPIFVKFNNLNCDLDDSIHLIACHYSNKKPDVNVYCEKLVEYLNDFYQSGVEANGKIYYPVLMNFVMDLEAKYGFYGHCRHNTDFGCTECLVKGNL